MDLKLLFVVVLDLISIIMGLVVFLNDTKKSTNRYFLLLVTAAVLWVSSLYLSNTADGNLLFLNKLIYLASSLIAISTVLLSIHFPVENNRLPKYTLSLIAIPTLIISCLIMFSNTIVADIKLVDWGTDIITGKYYFLYPLYFFPHFIAALWLLISKYKNVAKTSERLGIKLFIIGLAVSLAMGYATNSLSYYIFGNYYYSQYGYYSVVLFVILVGYSIVRQKLFNIKLILTETAVLIVSSALCAQLFISISNNLSARLVNVTILGFVLYGGSLLIKSVREEIERSKQIQQLANNLEKANNQLEKDKKELVELDRMKDEFLHMATHELNTPITAIKGRLDMAVTEDYCHLDEKQRAFLEPVLVDTFRLAHLSNDILDTARIDQNRMPLHVEDTDIDKLISETVNSLQVNIQERGNTLEYIKPETTLPVVKFDQSKIGEVITNLINNANKFTDKGKITVRVKVEGDFVVVSVSDTGIGINEEDQKHLFDKFYQVGRFDPDNPREQQGSGLGLYISKNIINLHGGKFWLESKPDQGTTFYFSLPLEYKEVKQPAAVSIFDHSLKTS